MDQILLIKTGKSETFNELSSSSIVSLGDTIRTAFLLGYFPKITWLTSPEALALLNALYPHISYVTNLDEIKFENYQRVINLEKESKVLELMSELKNFCGFFFDHGVLKFKSLNNGPRLIENELINHLDKPEEELLLELLGIQSQKNKKITSAYIGKNKNQFHVGLNWQVGKKWPQKKIDINFWKELESNIVEIGHSVSWQKGFDDINEYIEWIDSCQSIITLDSLGLHLANQLDKKVIGLFGPTNEKAIEISHGHKIKYKNAFEEIPKILSLL